MKPRADSRLDTSGLARPLPVLRARKALDSMRPGQVLEVTSTTAGTDADLELFAGRVGHELIGAITEGERTFFYIRKARER
ncbi:MAG: sulfurtransferase TusA family protein [Nitrospirota bacterium]|jgi:TusA-related sulfurtransferase